MLLAPGEVLHGDPPQLALEDGRAAVRIRGHRQHAALHAQPATAPAPNRSYHDRAAAIDVAIEQAVQGHDRVVVRGRGVHEVHDDPRLLARGPPRDSTHALLVHAPGGGRGQVHAHRRARRVPALGQQLRVDQHVDVVALVSGEDAGELALGRLTRDSLGLDARLDEGLGHVMGVAHAGGVDHAGHVLEADPVEVGHGRVERALVE